MRVSTVQCLLATLLGVALAGPGAARAATTWTSVNVDPGQKNSVYALHAASGESAGQSRMCE